MIVDASAMVAVLKQEPEALLFTDQIVASTGCRMSAVNFLEAAGGADFSSDPGHAAKFDDLFAETGIVIEPVTALQAKVAREAYRRYGKGSGHPAKLNMGDCFAYALAKVTGEPLLFKGNDFIHTDVAAAR